MRAGDVGRRTHLEGGGGGRDGGSARSEALTQAGIAEEEGKHRVDCGEEGGGGGEEVSEGQRRWRSWGVYGDRWRSSSTFGEEGRVDGSCESRNRPQDERAIAVGSAEGAGRGLALGNVVQDGESFLGESEGRRLAADRCAAPRRPAGIGGGMIVRRGGAHVLEHLELGLLVGLGAQMLVEVAHPREECRHDRSEEGAVELVVGEVGHEQVEEGECLEANLPCSIKGGMVRRACMRRGGKGSMEGERLEQGEYGGWEHGRVR